MLSTKLIKNHICLIYLSISIYVYIYIYQIDIYIYVSNRYIYIYIYVCVSVCVCVSNIYKQNLALNNPQGLVCDKPNPTKPNHPEPCATPPTLKKEQHKKWKRKWAVNNLRGVEMPLQIAVQPFLGYLNQLTTPQKLLKSSYLQIFT